jgi:hypothetical protein
MVFMVVFLKRNTNRTPIEQQRNSKERPKKTNESPMKSQRRTNEKLKKY